MINSESNNMAAPLQEELGALALFCCYPLFYIIYSASALRLLVNILKVFLRHALLFCLDDASPFTSYAPILPPGIDTSRPL
ncbi:hypothetical protein D770_04125 [Flammeovirgaceae bacterium 311]|nr:hypothetical protein D770_04125 [Flammeovirgaceae bacterium 311]